MERMIYITKLFSHSENLPNPQSQLINFPLTKQVNLEELSSTHRQPRSLLVKTLLYINHKLTEAEATERQRAEANPLIAA